MTGVEVGKVYNWNIFNFWWWSFTVLSVWKLSDGRPGRKSLRLANCLYASSQTLNNASICRYQIISRCYLLWYSYITTHRHPNMIQCLDSQSRCRRPNGNSCGRLKLRQSSLQPHQASMKIDGAPWTFNFKWFKWFTYLIRLAWRASALGRHRKGFK